MTARHHHPLLSPGAFAIGSAALILAVPAAAEAHVTATASDTAAGDDTIVTFSVPHGCEGSPTTKVAIQLPEGIDAVTPTRSPYYDVETTTEKLETPTTDSRGDEITERPDQVVYTARTPLPDGQRDTFELSLRIPEDAAGTSLHFPTVQTCEDGKTSWTQIPAEGQDEDDLEDPAPGIAVGAAGSTDARGVTAQASDGADVTEAAGVSSAWSSGGTSTALVVTSLVVGALGLLSGVAALLTVRRRG